MSGKRMLLLGAYSMEVVECGGALCKNAMEGGVSHGAILFAGEQMRRELQEAAAILGVSVEFLGMDTGAVTGSREEKLRLVEVIRRFRPEILLTQDPEHSLADLDPGRRPVMPMILEAVALASRPYALEELPGLEPCPCPTIYYMTPEHPNCLVDIASVWEKKVAAMDALKLQLEVFGGEVSPQEEALRARMIPGWEKLSTRLERGTAWKRQMDLAYALYPGATGHCPVMLAEQYRREGTFVLDNLLV
ncbi:MAG TPA: PIG-L family deacetylase [Firmicutes bacterium]|nr:PIG-L family deacetylase [Bacillota bacterium]